MIYYHQFELGHAPFFLYNIRKAAAQIGCEHIIACQDDRPFPTIKYWIYLFIPFRINSLSDDEIEVFRKYNSEEIVVRFIETEMNHPKNSPDSSRKRINKCDPKVKIILDEAL